MQKIAAALKAWSGIVALAWTTAGLAASGGTGQSATPHGAPGTPSTKSSSIELLQKQPTLAGTCGGSAFNVNTFINVDTFASAEVTVAAPGVGIIEQFTDETGSNIGPYNAVYPTFHILAFGGGLPPNTTLTITVTTYTGPNKTGKVGSVSEIAFNCTTGKVINQGPIISGAEPIPTLSTVALAAIAALLALLGGALLRRPARERSARR